MVCLYICMHLNAQIVLCVYSQKQHVSFIYSTFYGSNCQKFKMFPLVKYSMQYVYVIEI